MSRWLPALGVFAAGCFPLGDLDAAAAGHSHAEGGKAGRTSSDCGAAGACSADSGVGGSSDEPMRRCGDGHVDRQLEEECDDGEPTLTCNADCTAAKCDSACSCVMLNGQRYMFCKVATRDSAQETCGNSDMALVRIDDAEENDAIQAEADAQRLNYLWIGARIRSRNGVWSWEDGEALFGFLGGMGGGFTAWASGEPTLHECAIMADDGKWRAVGCEDVHDFVCELPEGA